MNRLSRSCTHQCLLVYWNNSYTMLKYTQNVCFAITTSRNHFNNCSILSINVFIRKTLENTICVFKIIINLNIWEHNSVIKLIFSIWNIRCSNMHFLSHWCIISIIKNPTLLNFLWRFCRNSCNRIETSWTSH